MSGIPDELVDKAAAIICHGYDAPHDLGCIDCTNTARAALEAVGLSALIERVEAAAKVLDEWTLIHDRDCIWNDDPETCDCWQQALRAALTEKEKP